MELSDWLTSSGVHSSRGAFDLFRQMHYIVVDYTGLLTCDWVKSRHAVQLELDRELCMVNLVDYLGQQSSTYRTYLFQSFHMMSYGLPDMITALPARSS